MCVPFQCLYTCVYNSLSIPQQLWFSVQVKVSDDECVHLRVYRNLQQEASLSGFLLGKTLQDPLEYFQ